MTHPIRVCLWATTFQADIFSLARYLCTRDDFEPVVAMDQAEAYQREPIYGLLPVTCPLLERTDSRTTRFLLDEFRPQLTITDNNFPDQKLSPYLLSVWHSWGWKGPQDRQEFDSVHRHIARLVGSAETPNPYFRWLVAGPSDLRHRRDVTGFASENLWALGSPFSDDILSGKLEREQLLRYYPASFADRRICLFAPTWHHGRAFAPLGDDIQVLEQLLGRLRERDTAMVLRLHDRHRFEPEYIASLERLATAHQDSLLLKFKDQQVDNLAHILVSDFMVSNYSGILTYYYFTGKPSIHVRPTPRDAEVHTYRVLEKGRVLEKQAPDAQFIWKLPAEEHGGLLVESIDELLAAVDRAVSEPDCCTERSRDFIQRHMLPANPEAPVCGKLADAIREWLSAEVVKPDDPKAMWEQKYQNPTEGGYLFDAPPEVFEIRTEWEKGLLTRRIFPLVHAAHSAGSRCLDVGCGDGKYARFFAEHFTHVTALDFSETVIARNRSEPHPDNLEYVAAETLEYLAGKKGEFDFVFVGGVLTYAPDDRVAEFGPALSESLAPGGVLVVRETVSLAETRINSKSDYLAYYRQKDLYPRLVYPEGFVRAYFNRGYKTMRVYKYLTKMGAPWLFNRRTARFWLALAALEDRLKAKRNPTANMFYIYQAPAR